MPRPQIASALAGDLNGRKAVLIVTGGIAAYKSCFLVRDLRRAGADVQVILTPAGAKFVSPLTFATLSGHLALTQLFPDPPPTDPIHLAAARDGDILIVAPASADFIAKMALGFADDLASTVALAFRGQILIAPAMNTAMWDHPALQNNLATLAARGVHTIGPETGEMAGVAEEAGRGRMSEVEAILARVEEIVLARDPWKGLRVLVTSGPTREPLDPIRFLGNRSSGRMGDAIARRAQIRGAGVVLVRGVGSAGRPPSGLEVVPVDSAAEMANAVKARFAACDLLIMNAAVADWTPDRAAVRKLKKNAGPPKLTLLPTEDILVWTGNHKKKQVVVGFALETAQHLESARAKLQSKKADLMALNDPTRPDSSFGGDTIKLTLISRRDRIKELPVLTKAAAADQLLDEIERMLPIRNSRNAGHKR